MIVPYGNDELTKERMKAEPTRRRFIQTAVLGKEWDIDTIKYES